MASSAKPKPPIAGPKAFLLIMGLSGLAGLLAGIASIMTDNLPGVTGFVVNLLINGTVMAIAMGLCVWWWRRIDEAAREAHKWAWWWGGCSGMAVGGAVLLTLLSREDQTILTGLTSNEVLAFGMTLTLGFLLVGYTIGWVAWWAQRR
ncbi:hypothetical protein [Brevundimonas sp. GCM10030266]|uniref:hypothetical protein n=1 Tax=Brevundimonas sp. GCM10030266 TaxID=3273386 RepID=UPI0036165EFC